jgi:hypothetical protein
VLARVALDPATAFGHVFEVLDDLIVAARLDLEEDALDISDGV